MRRVVANATAARAIEPTTNSVPKWTVPTPSSEPMTVVPRSHTQMRSLEPMVGFFARLSKPLPGIFLLERPTDLVPKSTHSRRPGPRGRRLSHRRNPVLHTRRWHHLGAPA